MAQKNDSAMMILEDVENIYTHAMAKGNFAIALKAKELLGREQGLFKSKTKCEAFSIDKLSEQDLSYMIKEIKKETRT